MERKFQYILDEILKMPASIHLKNLPDPDQEPFYYEKISNPISLSQIGQKILNKQYNDISEFKNDFYLVISNVEIAYGSNSLNYSLSRFLLKKFNELIEKINSNFSERVNNLNSKISHFCTNIDLIPEKDLKEILTMLSSKEIQLSEIKSHFSIGYPTLKIKIEERGLEYPKIPKGRANLKIEDEDFESVQTLLKHCSCGTKRTSEVLEMPITKVRKIFKSLNSENFQKVDKKEHNQRFHSTAIDALWHTDIHYLKDKPPYENTIAYLISFIDDLSREIVYWEILPNKSMELSTQALRNCINKTGRKPAMMTTDNKKEFVGVEFIQELEKNDIIHYKITRHNPEENGKIERFWQNIEKLDNYLDIGAQIELYNKTYNHRALKKYTGKDSSPERAKNDLFHIPIDKDHLIELSE